MAKYMHHSFVHNRSVLELCVVLFLLILAYIFLKVYFRDSRRLLGAGLFLFCFVSFNKHSIPSPPNNPLSLRASECGSYAPFLPKHTPPEYCSRSSTYHHRHALPLRLRSSLSVLTSLCAQRPPAPCPRSIANHQQEMSRQPSPKTIFRLCSSFRSQWRTKRSTRPRDPPGRGVVYLRRIRLRAERFRTDGHLRTVCIPA